MFDTICVGCLFVVLFRWGFLCVVGVLKKYNIQMFSVKALTYFERNN